jgi:starch synthase
MFSDIITTVSKTYAEEIQDPAFGEKLDGVFRKRKEDLYGILNGIDHTVYNPNSDPDIFINYQRSIKKKQQNKIKLQKLLGLPVTKEIPLISIMLPLISTKGLDLICCCLEEMLSMNIQVVVLGKGDHEYESKLQTIAKQYDEKISVNISFNESLARKIYAGSDMFLMPALFDPYGTEQLIALRYGSIPIVIESGGLKDGIQPFDKNTGEGNGFSFTDCNVHHLINTVKRAVDLFNQKEVWDKIVRNALKTNYSYRECANQYADLYKSLLDRQ